MFLNIALLFFVFGAVKKKFSPYLAAALLGAIKAAIYAVFTRQFIFAAIMGVIYFALTAGFVYFLTRSDRRDDRERPDLPSYTTSSTNAIKLRWEYAPLTVLLILIIGGEILLL